MQEIDEALDLKLRNKLKQSGFKMIAVRENNAGVYIAEVYFHPDKQEYKVKIREHVIGPVTLDELKNFQEVAQDVIWMRGQYSYIE